MFFLLFTTAISGWILLRTPYGGFPDEESHLVYAEYMHFHHSLPPIGFERAKILTPEGFQPPLYYALASLLVTRDHEAGILRVRVLSYLLMLFTIIVGWKTAELVFGNNHPAVCLTTAIIATNAQFLFTCSGITNLTALIATCALVFYFAVRGVLSEVDVNRNAIWMGVCFGLALLSRTISVFLALVCAASILWRAKQPRAVLKALLYFSAPAIVVAGWWYLRNWMYYEDPFLWKLHATVVGSEWVRNEPLNLFYLCKTGAFLHATYWAYFGRNEFHAGIWEYSAYMLMEVLAAWGFVEIVFRKSARMALPNPAVRLIVLTALTGVAEIVWMQTKLSIPQGRYFYISLVPISMIFASGLLQLVPARFDLRKAAVLFSLLFGLMCCYLLIRYYVPHV